MIFEQSPFVYLCTLCSQRWPFRSRSDAEAFGKSHDCQRACNLNQNVDTRKYVSY